MTAFADLPGEIRCLIYKHYFADTKVGYRKPLRRNPRTKHKESTDPYEERWWRLIGVEILLVSKLCRQEALESILLHKTIKIDRELRKLGNRPREYSLPSSLISLRHLLISGRYCTRFQGLVTKFTHLKTVEVLPDCLLGVEDITKTLLHRSKLLELSNANVQDEVMSAALQAFRKDDEPVFEPLSAWEVGGRSFNLKLRVEFPHIDRRDRYWLYDWFDLIMEVPAVGLHLASEDIKVQVHIHPNLMCLPGQPSFTRERSLAQIQDIDNIA